ncbi:methyltransferase-like protein 27 [Tachypleus tridentatus]|uniref:methyltransferase-like protein 27 n=1 Tax=Tachypleus tridentatus TaxID=6853 RepID=UPI003FD64086
MFQTKPGQVKHFFTKEVILLQGEQGFYSVKMPQTQFKELPQVETKVAKDQLKDVIKNASIQERPCEETMKYYKKWASDYDKDTSEAEYNGPDVTAEALAELQLPKTAKILDVAAGTGLVGEALRKRGFTNIDGLDGSQALLDIAKKKNVYLRYITALIGEGRRAPIDDNEYDGVVLSGAFSPGHLYTDCLPELIRIVKPGGYICWSMRDFSCYSERFKEDKFNEGVNELCRAGLWKKVHEPYTFQNFLVGKEGKIYSMLVTK